MGDGYDDIRTVDYTTPLIRFEESSAADTYTHPYEGYFGVLFPQDH